MSAPQVDGMDTPAQSAKRQDAMSRAAIMARQIVKEAYEAGRLMLRAEAETERKAAAGQAVRASRLAGEAANLLVSAGAVIPEWKAQAETFDRQKGFDLNQLATLDTPDARELLALVERAQSVAERVDKARGNCLPDDMPLQPGESSGTDLSEDLANLAARLRGEIFGGNGRD